jgi:predicted peptidase
MEKNIILIFLSVFIANTANSQIGNETGFLDRSLEVDGVNHKYQIYLPRDYDEERNWPVILFLHGGGERGDNGLAQTHVGLGRAIRFNPERWPAIVIFPQAAEGEFWIGETAEIAMAALDQTINNYSIDESRIYLTGLSLGGGGT